MPLSFSLKISSNYKNGSLNIPGSLKEIFTETVHSNLMPRHRMNSQKENLAKITRFTAGHLASFGNN